MKICPYCSGELPKNARVCTHCGMKIENDSKKEEKKEKVERNKEPERTMEDYMYQAMGLEKIGPLNKWIALVLCICLGFLGIHKIYERKYTMALLYACTGGLCGIGIILDLVNLWNKPNKYYVYRSAL